MDIDDYDDSVVGNIIGLSPAINTDGKLKLMNTGDEDYQRRRRSDDNIANRNTELVDKDDDFKLKPRAKRNKTAMSMGHNSS